MHLSQKQNQSFDLEWQRRDNIQPEISWTFFSAVSQISAGEWSDFIFIIVMWWCTLPEYIALWVWFCISLWICLNDEFLIILATSDFVSFRKASDIFDRVTHLGFDKNPSAIVRWVDYWLVNSFFEYRKLCISSDLCSSLRQSMYWNDYINIDFLLKISSQYYESLFLYSSIPVNLLFVLYSNPTDIQCLCVR